MSPTGYRRFLLDTAQRLLRDEVRPVDRTRALTGLRDDLTALLESDDAPTKPPPSYGVARAEPLSVRARRNDGR